MVAYRIDKKRVSEEYNVIQEVVDVIHEIKREEKIRCAILEAGVMKGRDYECFAILDYIEKKYAGIRGIREMIAEYLTEFVVKGENFGLATSCQKKTMEINK